MDEGNTVAIITEACSGINRAIARSLLLEGKRCGIDIV
jgi:NAD(P)-dependent dehydrogenase (short-subunit alcohol dehydrogenase family)